MPDGSPPPPALKLSFGGRAPRPTCPYLGHAGQDHAWRWNEALKLAFSTCCPQGVDIVGVVMKVKGLDYEEAKLWITKDVLHRDDLIRTTGAGGDQPPRGDR
jgi:hypothetical protein